MGKTNLLIPLCGKGQRFKDVGIYVSKPLIKVGHKTILEWSFDSIEIDKFNLIFVIKEDDKVLDLALQAKFINPLIIKVKEETKGAVDTCLHAKDLIDLSLPLSIFTMDVSFSPKFTAENLEDYGDGLLLTFSSTSPNYSYSEIKDYKVTRVAEKQVISTDASAGIYHFLSGELFFKYAEDMVNNYHGEMHIAPLYNYLIKDGYTIKTIPVDKIYIMGTPEEKKFIESILVNTTLPLGLMSDHSGFETKEKFKDLLEKYNFVDFGCYTDKQCDYPKYVNKLAYAMLNGTVGYGFGFCRTGQGVNIAANKYDWIRAALVDDTYTAKYAVKHNAANFFSIPDKVSIEEFEIILDTIMSNSFDGGRHQDRLMQL